MKGKPIDGFEEPPADLREPAAWFMAGGRSLELEREARVARLFEDARDLSEADRKTLLDRETAGEDLLRAEVLDLLERDEQASLAGFLDVDTREETPNRSGPKASPRPPNLYDIDMFPGSGPARAVDLPEFLKARMRLVAAILLAGSFAFFVYDLAGGKFDEPANRPIFYTHLLVIATSGACLVFVLRAKVPTVRTLRAIEAVCIISISAFYAHFQWILFSPDRWVFCDANSPDTDVLSLTGDSCIFRWFVLQVAYGFYLPNTWRRCALVIVGLGACPLVILVVQGVAQGTFNRLSDGLMEMGLWMTIGAAVGIYGSYKLTQLQSEAHEARQLGPYTLVRKIGSGGMGEVYLARHALLSRPCAVKLIRAQDDRDRETMLRFEREVQVTAGLMNPHTVRIFDFGIARDGTFYCTMEYLLGLNLHDLVRQHGPLPPGRVVHLLGQVCRALEEAHGLGLIHRDIKPGNIIVGPLGGIPDFVKLLDFGLAQAVATGPTKSPSRGPIAGTPGYLAPEQAVGLPIIDARSDLYSVGAVGHFLLAGRPPAAGGVSLPDTPSDLAEVIARCLMRDPADRFRDARDLTKALAACQSAGTWTESEAANWWRGHPAPD